MQLTLRKHLNLFLSFFAAIAILLSQTAFAEVIKFSEDTKPIRVAFPIQFGFTELDANGNYSGYTYDILMKIAQRTGWQYEFVTYEFSNEGLLKILDDLEKGEIDICGAMTYNDSLAEKYTFSETPYGYTSFILIALQNNNEINRRTISEYENLRIAIIERAQKQNAILDTYCKEKGIIYTPVYAKDNKEVEELIANGKADAFISKGVTNNPGYKTVANIGEEPFYFAVNKNKPELAKEIDKMLEEIRLNHPNYTRELSEKHFIEEYQLNLALSYDEMDFLINAPVIRATVMKNMPPWQSYDQKAEKYVGINVDILEKISEICGIKFEYIPVENLEEAKLKIKNGEADIIPSLPNYFPLCDEYDVFLTSSLISVPVIYVTNNNNKVDNIVVSTEIATLDRVNNFDSRNNIGDILSLVNSGEYHAYVDGYGAQHYISTSIYPNISVTTLPYGNYDMSIAVSRKSDIRVVRVLEQAIASIPDSQIESIIYENTTHSHETTLADAIKRNPIEIISIVGILAVVIITLLAIIYLRTKKLNRLISLEKNKYLAISQMDRLTKTYNNTSFKQFARVYTENSLNPKGALIVCDIDDFKYINDTHGHLVGDEVLTKIGEIIVGIFRERDIVGRLGGDEMVILIKDLTDESIIRMRCEEILHKCSKISSNFKVTMSIGAVIFEGNTSFDGLFIKADEALYDVKGATKNGYKIVKWK